MDLMKADLEGGMMNTQSCVDHSILAIFEDSRADSEVSGHRGQNAITVALNRLHSAHWLSEYVTRLKESQTQSGKGHYIVLKELD